MKKLLISLLLGFSVSHMYAQTYEGVISGSSDISYIPKIYTSDHTAKFVCNNWYDNKHQFIIYNEKFELEKQFEFEGKDFYLNLYDLDEYKYINVYGTSLGAVITQSLFNDDEKYELLTYDKDDETPYICKRYKIISEDGNIINTIEPENGYVFVISPAPCLIKNNNIFYLAISAVDILKDESVCAYYRIDKSTSNIQLAAKMPMSVSPTIASQSDIITVELGENNNAKEIEIINASGQLVKRVPVTPGQKSVSFNAQGITRGVNMVHAPGENNNATKIIIK